MCSVRGKRGCEREREREREKERERASKREGGVNVEERHCCIGADAAHAGGSPAASSSSEEDRANIG